METIEIPKKALRDLIEEMESISQSLDTWVNWIKKNYSLKELKEK